MYNLDYIFRFCKAAKKIKNVETCLNMLIRITGYRNGRKGSRYGNLCLKWWTAYAHHSTLSVKSSGTYTY